MQAVNENLHNAEVRKETQRSNLAREAEDYRYHSATLAENERSHRAQEQISLFNANENQRHNLATERESSRSNKANEQIRSRSNDISELAAQYNYSGTLATVAQKDRQRTDNLGLIAAQTEEAKSRTVNNSATLPKIFAETTLTGAQIRKTNAETKRTKEATGSEMLGAAGRFAGAAANIIKLFM